jgi:hypothetical protein
MLRTTTRRRLLGGGLGAIALAALEGRTTARTAPRPRAKNVIYLHMAGAPSQIDLFEDKPVLKRLSGKPCPPSLLEGKRFAFIKGVPSMLGSPFPFRRVGRCGATVSSLLPQFGRIVDHVAIIRSMMTDEFNHAPAQLFALTGRSQFGGASLGSWVTYGIGSENANLPGFVVLLSGGKTPDGGKSLWGSGFLPSVYQGVQCRTDGDPVLFLSEPAGLDRKGRREILDAIRDLNALQAQRLADPEIDTRVSQYELAFRMQVTVPEVMDIAKEPRSILDLYGAVPHHRSEAEHADDPRTLYKGNDPTFANNCLLARRLVEKGVRFVQLFDWGWDHHGISPGESIDKTLPIKAQQIDRAISGLLTDLEQRGLLDETLVVWSGEFGRTPMQQNAETQAFIGRDHHPHAFTSWLAGGGIKPGISYGETDEIGFNVVKDAMHVRDLQATILHLLGFDPFRFSYPFQGLDQRLIGPDDSKAKVHHALIA